MRKIHKLLILLILLFIVPPIYAQNGNSYLDNPIYRRQIEFYKLYKPQNVDVIMLGNSLTHGVDWNQLLGRNDVVEMGIVSDITAGFLARMKYVYRLKPKVCFVMGGINDIYKWIPVEIIFDNYKKIIAGLKEHHITPVIESCLYAGKNWGKEWLKQNKPELRPADVNAERNSQVRRLNEMLKKYANANNIIYIDLNRLVTRGNYLRSELNYDGLHLNAAGYKIWGRKVEETLRKLGF